MPSNTKEYRKEYYKKHKDKFKEYAHKHFANNKEKVSSYCKKWREKNRDKTRVYGQRDYFKHWEKRRQCNRERCVQLKKEVLTHYGNSELKCVKCGFNNLHALTIDHINGNGRNHRKQLGIDGGGRRFYFWLKKENYPEGYRTLCANCQFIEHANKVAVRIEMNKQQMMAQNEQAIKAGGVMPPEQPI